MRELRQRTPSRRGPGLRPLALLLVTLAAVNASALTGVAGGPVFQLPNWGTINKSGLSLHIDGRGIDGNGYRPVRVTVTTVPRAPLTADRQVRVVLRPMQYSSVGTPEVSQVIELPEGSSQVSTTIALPQNGIWYSMSIETYEGGEKWDELSTPYMGWPNSGYWDWTEARPAILFVDRDVLPRGDRDLAVQNYRTQGLDPKPTHDLPDGRTLAWVFPDPNRTPTMPSITGAPTGPAINTPDVTDVALLSQMSDLSRVDFAALNDLSERWIEMSQVDVAVISLGDLKELAAKHPERLSALRAWLSTGPMLMVYGVGDDFAQLAALETTLELPALPAKKGEPADHRGWTTPKQTDDTGSLKTPYEEDYGSLIRQAEVAARATTIAEMRAAEIETKGGGVRGIRANGTTAFTFLHRPAKLGVVVAIGSEQPFPGKESDWIWIFNSVNDNHWRWYQRNGFSLHRQNDDYWMFLIPGVGEAPVISFLLLVSLFAVVIGPVNYVFLGRARRLYLLLITVPLGAMVVTLCLFGYAMVTDGLGVRLRARSYADLDQRTGEAAIWSRQSYYAAISPSSGLVFPEDTTIFPLVYQPNRVAQTAGATKMSWDDGQRLQTGFLPSRTATQFVLARATTSPAKLAIRETKGQAPAVTNQFGAAVRYLLLCDAKGDYYAAGPLDEGKQATLKRAELAPAERELRKLFEEVEPDYPRNYNPAMHNNAISLMMPNLGGWMGVDPSASSPVMAVSLLEMNLAAASQPTKRPLEPQSYIAILETSPLVPIGVPSVSEEASLHVIRGKY